MSLHVGLEGAFGRQAEVLSLGGGKSAELSLAVSEVKTGNLLVQYLGQDVDTNVQLAGLGEFDVLGAPSRVAGFVQHDLGKNLVGEGAGHDERGVAGGTAEVNKTTLGEEDDVAARWHEEAIDLGLDVLHARGVLLEPGNVDLDVKVANVYRKTSS